jgi:D-psicose/D-tagatose/L-ribulose 3-epimerase
MKLGFCMLLWATSVDASHRRLIEDIKQTGYDGIEVPIFAGTPDDYAKLGGMLDEVGLERLAITVIPDVDKNPVSADAGDRKRAVDYLNWCVDCAAALGARQLAGPVHQTLGYFSGAAPTDEERSRVRDVHRAVGDHAKAKDVTVVLEALNRFECYFANTMDDLCAHVAAVGHPSIRAMYDTFHANIEEKDPVAAYSRNKQYVAYVHTSENDRGVPGRGHVPWAATFKALKQGGYDGWLTIEAFGRGLPELAAATRVWRDYAESPEAVYRDGYKFIRKSWDAA